MLTRSSPGTGCAASPPIDAIVAGQLDEMAQIAAERGQVDWCRASRFRSLAGDL
jgi:hypothetical protein